jgi:hypothetical protein
MTDDPERTVVDPQIQIGVDNCGDPFIRCNIKTPEGAAFSAEMADQLGLQLIAAAAAARVRASAIRKQLLAGATAETAVHLVNSLLEP